MRRESAPRGGRCVLLMIAMLAAATLALTAAGRVDAAAPAEASASGGEDWTGRKLDPTQGPFAAGAAVYQAHCAGCHDAGLGRTPQKMVLRDMTPRAILAALTDGAMRAQGAALSGEDKVAVAEFVAGRRKAAAGAAPAETMCQGKAAEFDPGAPPGFVNWGLDAASTHAIPTSVAGLDKNNLGKLKLKWAYGFADSQRMRSQPALAGGAIYVGNHTGSVRAIDRASGCTRWTFDAVAEVRTGVVVSPWRAGDARAQPLVFFGDLRANVYALDARTGKLVWKINADRHPAALITGTPAYHDGMLYVPVSSVEEATAASPGYGCCTFRGSLLALKAATGDEVWRTYFVDPAKAPAGDERQWGPSGVAVWNSPAIDAKRGQIYVATGDNYSTPTTNMSDSILALDLRTGAIRWHYQALAGDAWNVACYTRVGSNCPEDAGPDFDFGAGTILAKGKDGKDKVLAGQKAGIAYGLDPATGALAWQTRVGRGSEGGGILFGMAAANGLLFAPVNDPPLGHGSDFPRSPGVHAIDIASGKVAWFAPSPTDTCEGRKNCGNGYSGSLSATPELVLAGNDDGHVRIFDSASGAVLWDYDTVHDFETVNGVAGHGGSIGGGAAVIAQGGQLIVTSGYGFASKMPGNVLLVFDTQ